MSSRKRGSSSSSRRKTTKSSQPAEALLGSLAKNPALLGIVVLIGLIIGGYYYLVAPTLNPDTATEESNTESSAGQVGRSTPDTAAPNQPVSGLGSGGQAVDSWYELHFNNPTYPNKKENNVGGLDTHLVNLINKATKSVDMAIYDFDLPNVAEALAAAKNRGATVRLVIDTDTLNHKDEAIQATLAIVKKAKIPIVDDNRGPIMHNKFTIVDGEWLQTGSWNYTTGDTYRLNNHMIIIRHRDLARNYTNEFEKMFVKKEFGPKSKDKPFPVLTIGNARVETYFSAEDDITPRLVELVNGAKQSVYFMAFSYTEDKLGDAMISRAKAGVKVQGVFEKTGSETKFSEFGRMKTAGLDVYQDGNPYVMHHKVIVVDEKIVVFGSFNFSQNAEKSNDENMLIVEDPALAKAFLQEYNKILELAKNPPKRS